MPKDYLVAQLRAFKSGERSNDAQAQMRAVAITMTDKEIDEVATFYARKAAAPEPVVSQVDAPQNASSGQRR